MIVTPHFVYLHLHKSGGTFINEALLRFVPGAAQIGYHLPASRIPTAARGLPVLGFVRSPWSYYVSWFSFQTGLPRQNHLFRCVSEDNTLGFKDSIRRLLNLGGDADLLERVLRGLPEGYVDHGLNLPRTALEPIRNSGLGFYNYLYQYMYGGCPQPPYIGRTECLRQDLPELFERVGFAPPAAMIEYIRIGAERNRSRHQDYRDYYDDELRQLVAGHDRALIHAHGFSFGPAPAGQASGPG
ncbi:MAG TPA: hypothetical protein VNX47_04155 [Nevskia sp.]|jgi:hypothetical protein|nr:hypothetical protein [Nevskia sp.]